MKREQIIKMLKNKLWGAFKQGQKVSPFDADNSEFWAPFFYGVAISLTDAILALPLDVPSDEEINKAVIKYATVEVENDEGGVDKFVAPFAEFYQDGIDWMRDEILKRNK